MVPVRPGYVPGDAIAYRLGTRARHQTMYLGTDSGPDNAMLT